MPYSNDNEPTLFDTFIEELVHEDVKYTLSLTDLGGSISVAEFRIIAYQKVDVFFLCYSVDDKRSFEAISEDWIEEIHSIPGNETVPKLLVGLKDDLHCFRV